MSLPNLLFSIGAGSGTFNLMRNAMRTFAHRFIAIIATVLVTISLVGAALANDDDLNAVPEVKLTEAQMRGALGAMPELTKRGFLTLFMTADKVKQNRAELDAICAKHGLKDYDEFDLVFANIGLVSLGFDMETRSYVGMTKLRLKQIERDVSLDQARKKQELEELQAQLKSEKPLKHPENINLVTKYLDKILEAQAAQ